MANSIRYGKLMYLLGICSLLVIFLFLVFKIQTETYVWSILIFLSLFSSKNFVSILKRVKRYYYESLLKKSIKG